jgi:endonuclease G
MVKKTLIFIFVLLLSCYSTAQKIDLLPTTNGEIVSHKYYTLSYVKDYKQSEWVFYLSVKSNLNDSVERDNQFRKDPLVNGKLANNGDYMKTGYDRGHLCPAADMSFSLQSMSESFYFSNISPQVPNFNRGVWSNLEEQVRDWVKEKDSLYIVTGPIFLNVQGYIGQNRIAVPGYFYKIVYSPRDREMIGFVLPNKKGNSNNLSKYIYSVDYIEVITKIDFFHNIPDSLQRNIEDKVNLNYWMFQKN